MNSKEEFKSFVKQNPVLIKYIKSGEMTWQKFYEIYDLYGSDYNAWKDYLKQEEEKKETNNRGDFVSFIKNIDMDKIEEGVNSLQRVLGVITEMAVKNKTETGKYQASILFVVELIFAAIPLGLSVIALAWVTVTIAYHFLLGVVFILDKLKI